MYPLVNFCLFGSDPQYRSSRLSPDQHPTCTPACALKCHVSQQVLHRVPVLWPRVPVESAQGVDRKHSICRHLGPNSESVLRGSQVLHADDVIRETKEQKNLCLCLVKRAPVRSASTALTKLVLRIVAKGQQGRSTFPWMNRSCPLSQFQTLPPSLYRPIWGRSERPAQLPPKQAPSELATTSSLKFNKFSVTTETGLTCCAVISSPSAKDTEMRQVWVLPVKASGVIS